MDARDVVKAMILLMDNINFEKCKNQRFLLSAENLSYQELFYNMADSFGKQRPKYFASDLVLSIAWRAATLYGWLTGNPSAITRETVASSNLQNRFDGTKISRATGLKYRPISETIRDVTEFLKQDF